MKIIKRVPLVLAIILIMMGVCGCMNEEKDFQTPVLAYLNEKYGCDFNVQSVFNEKECVRLVCESAENPGELFRAECYLADGEKTGDSISVDGEEYLIYEKYSDIVFAKQMEQELKQAIRDDVFVRCKILCNHSVNEYYGTTREQYEAGMKFCLEQSDVYSYVSAYIVMGADADLDKIQAAAEAYALDCNAHAQYLCYAVMPELMEDVAAQHYEENKDSFVAHMGICELILQMESVELERNNGIIGRIIEKG